MENVTNYEWLDKDTFVVNFEPKPTTLDFELKGVTEEVVVEYHKDERKWIADVQYFDADGGFIDHDTDALTPYKKAEYISVANELLHSKNSWDEIIVADDYEKYDALVDLIKNYYAKDDEETAIRVEDIVNARFIELLDELDEEFNK